MCLMELTACLAGEEHTAMPDCTSPTLAQYATLANDTLAQEPRQKLIPLAQELAGANCPECEERRVVSIVMDTIRNDASQAMRELGMPEWADRLSSITEDRARLTMAAALTMARNTVRYSGRYSGGTEEENPNLMTLARTFGAANNTWPRSSPPDPCTAMMFSSMAARLATPAVTGRNSRRSTPRGSGTPSRYAPTGAAAPDRSATRHLEHVTWNAAPSGRAAACPPG